MAEETSITLANELALDRCPHCSVDRPRISLIGKLATADYRGFHQRVWAWYLCARCGGLVLAAAEGPTELGRVTETYPAPRTVDANIPSRAKSYLEQALNSIHAPSGAIMLAGSAVDAMLKELGYRQGKLYPRINQAQKDHKITDEMAKWAHEVRLDANEERHADENYSLPDSDDAKHSIEFALALAEFLFVLPARVKRGLKDVGKGPDEAVGSTA